MVFEVHGIMVSLSRRQGREHSIQIGHRLDHVLFIQNYRTEGKWFEHRCGGWVGGGAGGRVWNFSSVASPVVNGRQCFQLKARMRWKIMEDWREEVCDTHLKGPKRGQIGGMW